MRAPAVGDAAATAGRARRAHVQPKVAPQTPPVESPKVGFYADDLLISSPRKTTMVAPSTVELSAGARQGQTARVTDLVERLLGALGGLVLRSVPPR
jgi:hypothetical protein